MIETTLLGLFLFTFGIQVGGILRDRQYWRSVRSQVKEQVASPWYGPQVLAGRIHADQDCVPDVGPLILSQTVYCRLLHTSVRAR